jgi:hypothetical protein
MSLTDLASIGSFISGAGVLISLIYLAFQIRQNTLTHRATAYLSRQAFLKDQINAVMDPILGPIRARVFAGDESVTDAEYQQFFSQQVSWFIGQEGLVWLRDNRILDETAYHAEDLGLRIALQEPPVRATWEVWKPLATPSLRRIVEAHLARPAPAQRMPVLADWKAALAAARRDAAAHAAAPGPDLGPLRASDRSQV